MVEKRKRAGIFNRESKGKESSIDDQDRENRAACDELDAEVVVALRDKVSASRQGTKARDGWPQVIEWVTSGKLDLLVVWEVSRADRTMDTWVPFLSACRDHGVRIHVTSEETTYNPRKAAHRKALLDAGSAAEHETERLSERSRRGIAGAVLKGKQHGRAPWGYTRVYDQHDRKIFTQVKNEHAPIVREIIERVARNDPIVHIVADLNKRGVPAPEGGAWNRNSLRVLVRRPTYAGLRGHNGTTHPGNWPAIVDEDVWRTAQEVLDDPSRKTTAPGRYRWLLSYLATAPCGGYLNARQRSQGGRFNYGCAGDGCVGIGVIELDEFVTRLALARLAKRNARDLFAARTGEAAAARRDIKDAQDELDDLAEQITKGPKNGGVSATLAAKSEPGIVARLADAERRLKNATRHGAVLALLGEGKVTEALLRPRWEWLSVAGRRSVIDALIEEVRVYPADERASRWTSEDDRLRLASERTKITWRR